MNRSSPDDTQQEVSAPPLDRYLDGAIRLRQAATWNAFDSDPAVLPRRVIPVVDADVVRMFMAPAAETDYVDPFPSPKSSASDLREWNEPLALVAAATAEFIFLTDTIQVMEKTVSKWGEPVRVASTHFDDVNRMLNRIIQRIVGKAPSIRDLEDTAIERFDIASARFERDGSDGLNELVRALPSSLSDLYMGPVYEAERWFRLRDRDQIGQLDGLREASSDILDPDKNLINHWRDRLIESLTPPRSATRDQGRRRTAEMASRVSDRARRDATALANVTALNEAGLQEDEKKGWRAILITGDDHLHRMYARWVWETSGSNMQPERYVLRRPLQFTPVLNVASMSNDDSTLEIFRKLTDALDHTVNILLDPITEVRNPYLLELHWERRRKARLQTLDRDAIQRHLANCNEHWLEAINHINARNHPYLTRDYKRLFEKLREAFDTPDARTALLDYTISVVNKINAEHFSLLLDETVYELARLTNPIRMPFLVRADFPEFLDNGGSTTQFLFGKAGSVRMVSHDLAELRSVATRIRASVGARGAFLTAILAAAGGAYIRASGLMAQAKRLAKDDSRVDESLLSEMNYFHVLIMRLNLKTFDDYKRSREMVEGLLQIASRKASNDHFELARGNSEAAAVELSWSSLAADIPGLDPEKKASLERGKKYLETARRWLSRSIEASGARQEVELAQQIIANVIAINLYDKVTGGEADIPAVRWAHEQFRKLRGDMLDEADYVTKLLWLAGVWLIDQTRENGQALRKNCEETLTELRTREAPAADRHGVERVLTYFRSQGL